MRKDNRIAGVILFALFAYSFYMALDFNKRAAYFPIFVSATGMLLSVFLFISGFLKERGAKESSLTSTAKLRVAVMAAAILIYAAGIEYVGFSVSTFAFLFVMMCVGYTKKLTVAQTGKILIVAAVMTGVIYYVFEKLLFVPLPHGLLI
ncbi:MAG: tripartite tricarboxylate transporter TctB family protein [Pyramidobacter sp.]|nr:tripartite tricarboxylate transporter TctB family protein [Pyramidobacter sp.]